MAARHARRPSAGAGRDPTGPRAPTAPGPSGPGGTTAADPPGRRQRGHARVPRAGCSERYDVTAVSDGMQALAAVKAQPPRPDPLRRDDADARRLRPAARRGPDPATAGSRSCCSRPGRGRRPASRGWRPGPTTTSPSPFGARELLARVAAHLELAASGGRPSPARSASSAPRPSPSSRASPTASSRWTGTGGSPTSTPGRADPRPPAGRPAGKSLWEVYPGSGRQRVRAGLPPGRRTSGSPVVHVVLPGPRPLVRGPRLPGAGRHLGLLPGRLATDPRRGGAGAARPRPAGCRPAQGRVPGDARPRAAQPPGTDSERGPDPRDDRRAR